MPAFYPLQSAFNGGEISGRVSGRRDLDLYKVALAYALNVIPLPHGPVLMRAGSDHVQQLAGDNRTRLVAMRMSDGQDYLVEFYDHVARLYGITGAQVQATGVATQELLVNGDFTSGPAGWTPGAGFVYTGGFATPDDTDNSFTRGKAYFHVHAGTSPGDDSLAQSLVTLANADSLEFSFEAGDLNLVAQNGAKIEVKLGTALGASDLYHLDAPPTAGVTTVNIPGPIALGTNIYLYVRCYIGPSGFISYFSLDNVSLVATYSVTQFDIPTPWSAGQLAAVRFASETGRNRTDFVHPNVQPWFISYSDAGAWSFSNVVFASQPAGWGGANWPAAVEVHDGRVFYAGEPNAKNRIVASKSGEPDNFLLGQSDPGDALDLKVSTKGALRWMKSMRALLSGSDLGEHSVNGSMGVPLNGDIHARTESAFGSASIQAIDVGSYVMYVTKDRRRVRSIKYDLRSEGWESEDATFAAEHLTKPPHLIKELHHALTPDSLLIAVLDSGELRICVYEPDKKVTAWARVVLSSGLVRSAAVSSGDQGAFLWMAVERDGVMHLERLTLSDLDTNDFLDASKSFGPVNAGDALNMAHLVDGTTVSIIIDGDLYPDAQVAGGSVPSPDAGAAVTVGLRFPAQARTLAPEGGNPAGSSLGFKAHNVDFAMVVNNSAAPKVNGTRLMPDPGSATPADAPEVLRTGVIFADNVDVDDGSVLIEQDLPYRTEICAIGGKRQLSKV